MLESRPPSSPQIRRKLGVAIKEMDTFLPPKTIYGSHAGKRTGGFFALKHGVYERVSCRLLVSRGATNNLTSRRHEKRAISRRKEDVIPIDPMDLRVPRLIAVDSGIHTHACDLLRDVRIFPNGINRETVSANRLDFFSTLLNNATVQGQ